MRLGDGNAAALGELCQQRFRFRIEHAAARDDQRVFRGLQRRDGGLDLAHIGALPALTPQARLQKMRRNLERLGLYILAEGERHRPAFRRIGEDGHGAVERRHDLFGPRDAVEIARHRAETIIRGDGAVAEILHLLQHRIGAARGEDVAGQQQHRQPVHMRDGGGGDHIRRAGTDGGGAGHHAAAARGFGESAGRQRHRLLIMRAEDRQCLPRLIQRLAEPGDIAVAENRPDAAEQRLNGTARLHFLSGQEACAILSGGQSHRGHGALTSFCLEPGIRIAVPSPMGRGLG